MKPYASELLRKFLEAEEAWWDRAPIEARCASEGISVVSLIEEMTAQLVDGYLSGQLQWPECDVAINALSIGMTNCAEIPQFPWAIFLAFDAGEWHPHSPELSPDEVTRPLVEALVAAQSAQQCVQEATRETRAP